MPIRGFLFQENAKDELIATKIDLTQTELELMDHINEMNRLMETYGLLVKRIDDKAFLVTQESDYEKFLKSRLDEVHQNMLNQRESIEEKKGQLASLRLNLKEAQDKIQQLMHDKESILSDMGRQVEDLKK